MKKKARKASTKSVKWRVLA